MSNSTFDIIIIGDFRFPGGAASGPAEQIRAQSKAGYRTGLMQVKAPVLKFPHPFNPNIRQCLDDGMAELIDPAIGASAPLALAFHPQVFTHRPRHKLKIQADQKILVTSHPLIDGWGDAYYDWKTINQNAQESLGGNVTWAPLGPLVRQPFPTLEDAPPLHEFDWLEVLDIDAWAANRKGFCADRPVIGRHSRPDYLKWPDDRETTLAVYPEDPEFAVKVLGGGDYLIEHLGEIPANWQVLPFNGTDPKSFLGGIDFYVYFHHSRWVEAFGRVMLEGLASGALTILPKHFEPLFEEAAVYCEPAQAPELVREFYADRAAYETQVDTAYALIREKLSHEAHIRRLRDIIGKPAKTAKKPSKSKPKSKPKTEPAMAAHRVLFLTSNGVGMGHLTRLLSVARRCRPEITPVFATMSQAFRVVQDFGYSCEYIPYHGYLNCDMTSWNHFLRLEINELISFHRPSVLVFDGNVAYGGLISAIRDNPACLSVWCRRALWRPGTRAEDNISRETAFDAIIEPGEIAAEYDVGLTTLYRSKTRTVDPVRLLDDEDLLSRRAARTELGLDQKATAVLVQLGAQNNFVYDDVRDAVFTHLGGRENVQVAAAEWLISTDTPDLPDDVIGVRTYPLGKYLKAFDFVVSAAGYNGYHELLMAGIPAIFVPNENPMMDEQLARAQFAEKNGLGLCLRTRDVYSTGAQLDRMLDADFRAAIAANCAKLEHANGASQIATSLEESVLSMRADREERNYWSAV
jgi:glycosyl transferase family 28